MFWDHVQYEYLTNTEQNFILEIWRMKIWARLY